MVVTLNDPKIGQPFIVPGYEHVYICVRGEGNPKDDRFLGIILDGLIYKNHSKWEGKNG